MTEVENFIYRFEGNQQSIMLYFHELLLSYPHVTCKLSYKLPFYNRKSWICYLNPTKKGGVEFAFPRGNELSNMQGLLKSKGRKQVMGIEFASLQDIPGNIINEIIQEALLLDESVPYNIKKYF